MEPSETPPVISKESGDWRVGHPLLKAAREGTGFICYHTQDLTREAIEEAIRDSKSIEIDANLLGPSEGDFPQDFLVVSHHPWYDAFTRVRDTDYTKFLSPNEVISLTSGKEVFVKFDLKTPQVIPWLLEAAQRVSPHLRMVHAFVSELHYSYKQEQGHHVTEYVSLADVKKIRKALDGIPFQVSCRGISLEELSIKRGNSYPLVDRLCTIVDGDAEVINFNLMDDQNLPPEISFYVWKKHGLLTEINIDRNPRPPLGIPYLGTTDNMTLATKMGS